MFTIYNNGKPAPMGYSIFTDNGVKVTNFALFSGAASGVELCLFDGDKETRFPMVRTNNVWNLAVAGVEIGTEYGFRIHGEHANPNKLMFDPYAKAVNGKPDLTTEKSRSWFLMNDHRDNAHIAPRAVIISEYFDWEMIPHPIRLGRKPLCMNCISKVLANLTTRFPLNYGAPMRA